MSYHQAMAYVARAGGKPRSFRETGEGYVAHWRLPSGAGLRVIVGGGTWLVDLKMEDGGLRSAFVHQGSTVSGDLTGWKKQGTWAWGEALVRLL